VFCLYRVLSADRISVVGIAIGASTVLLLWVVSDASVGPVVPSLGEISGREFIDAVVIVPLIGFIALGFVSSVTEVNVSTPQYYGLILGAVGGGLAQLCHESVPSAGWHGLTVIDPRSQRIELVCHCRDTRTVRARNRYIQMARDGCDVHYRPESLKAHLGAVGLVVLTMLAFYGTVDWVVTGYAENVIAGRAAEFPMTLLPKGDSLGGTVLVYQQFSLLCAVLGGAGVVFALGYHYGTRRSDSVDTA
jgi:hypothetical protein